MARGVYKVPSLTQERLRDLLSYDPSTGLWTWIVKKGRYSANRIGGSLAANGHLVIRIDQVTYYAHQLAWFWMTNTWVPEIDHKDLCGTNNKWENLRAATRTQNNANTHKRKKNVVGLKGVSRAGEKFRTRVGRDGVVVFYKVFDCPAAAHLFYLIEANKAFGEFSRGTGG